VSGQLHWGDLVVAGDARRREVRDRRGNGVDAVEVREGGRRLLVFFLEHTPSGLHPGNIRIDAPSGGRSVRAVEVRRASDADRELEDHLIVELDHPGSAGSYRLQIVERAPDGRPGLRTQRGIDPRFDAAQFAFDIDAPRPPIAAAPGGAPSHDYDDVSYLLRDYEGLRQLMLDRLAVTLPAWTERHIPDPWVTLIELLAYVGDDLSYYQDAVATEAYLQTARRRVSVRRHARLVDYRLHDGCNARAWVSVQVSGPVTLTPQRVRFAAVGALLYDRPPVIDADTFPPDKLVALQQYSLLPAHPRPGRRDAEITLRPAHNQISLWSWGELNSHLAAGATSAVLVDGAPADAEGKAPKRPLQLAVGDVIILEEKGDPLTQGKGPPDPAHRHAVRLTEVRRLTDDLYQQPLLDVRWAAEDALGFDLPVLAGGHPVGQATGNVVLVGHGIAVPPDVVELAAPSLCRIGLTFSTPFPDPAAVARHQARVLRGLHGAWRRELREWRTAGDRGTPLHESQLNTLAAQVGVEELERVGLTDPWRTDDEAAKEGYAERDAEALEELLADADRLLARRRRRLELLAALAQASGPLEDVLIAELEQDWGRELTAGLDPGRAESWGPASQAVTQDPRAALPVLELVDASASHSWLPSADLIGASPADRALVAEVDDQGIARLRVNGAGQNVTLEADYWIGTGSAGNTEAEAINAVVWLPGGAGAASSRQSGAAVSPPTAIVAVRNPLPASGGVDPERVADAKRAIPGSYLQNQPRALTAGDYESLAAAVPGVRRAAAELRFSGSLTTVDVAIQPAVGEDPHPDLLASVEEVLAQGRRIGHVVRISAPRYRPLVLGLTVTLAASAVRADVAGQLSQLLSSGWAPDGTPALFNPERLGFAAAVYPSPIIAAVHAVDGVQAVTITGFGFLGGPPASVGSAPAAALAVGTLQIPRLDNDPTVPQRGYALVALEGGR
jgi:predicted phage baseplate assembly protein